jgi:hypothetical protein
MASDTRAPETEITPAMIEAGCQEFWGHDNQYESPAELVRRIYSAMARAKTEGFTPRHRPPHGTGTR